MISTEAWVLYQGAAGGGAGKPEVAELKKEIFTFSDLTESEVLVEPIYGCWEGNMSHAVERDPVDICRQRGEEKVVVGNAGVVRVLRTGEAVKGVKEGDLCLVFCNGVWDARGFPKKIYAYDAPNTVGLLAKQTKLNERQLIPLPENTRYTPQQWAAFSLRYITAWANWKAAYGSWRLHTTPEETQSAFVWGWGGGVTLAELTLAKYSGCNVAMISSDDSRLELIEQSGIVPIDRRQFGDLQHDEARYQADPAYRKAYQASEESFLNAVKYHTQGSGVSIFIDYIGQPVYRATLKALARPGVITTAGWKEGMKLSTVRALECMNWHFHIHTHYARYADGLEAIRFAEENGWMPTIDGDEYDWESVPQLARDHINGSITTYFPIYSINPL